MYYQMKVKHAREKWLRVPIDPCWLEAQGKRQFETSPLLRSCSSDMDISEQPRTASAKEGNEITARSQT
jgi:hypothetical protein